MNLQNWELETETGYTFEFIYKSNPNISITIFANSEAKAWEILSSLK